MQMNALISTVKSCVFILLTLFSMNAFAEYYLVYSAPAPCVEYAPYHPVKKKIRRHVVRHSSCHRQVRHQYARAEYYQVKNCNPRRAFVVYYSQPEIYGETYYHEEIVNPCQ